MKSLLSANLWEIGWYSLLHDECESEIGTEKPGGISVIDRNAISCNCKSVIITTSKSALFELVVLSQGCTETMFSTNDELVFQSQECMFVLAVQPTENEEAQAVVFSFNNDNPALVPI